jgi:hypothetical protein
MICDRLIVTNVLSVFCERVGSGLGMADNRAGSVLCAVLMLPLLSCD